MLYQNIANIVLCIHLRFKVCIFDVFFHYPGSSVVRTLETLSPGRTCTEDLEAKSGKFKLNVIDDKEIGLITTNNFIIG